MSNVKPVPVDVGIRHSSGLASVLVGTLFVDCLCKNMLCNMRLCFLKNVQMDFLNL